MTDLGLGVVVRKDKVLEETTNHLLNYLLFNGLLVLFEISVLDLFWPQGSICSFFRCVGQPLFIPLVVYVKTSKNTESKRPGASAINTQSSSVPTERLLRLLTATLEQQAAIDRILEGKMEITPPAPSGPLLLAMGEAATYLGVSRSTLWRLLKSGQLKPVEILPGFLMIRRSDLEALCEEKK